MMKLYEVDPQSGRPRETECIRKKVAVRLFSGVGLFETTKILKGIPLFIEEHVGRIISSAREIWGNFPDREKIERASFEVSRGRKLGMLRIFFVEERKNFYVFLLVDDFPYRSTEGVAIKVLEYERNPESFSAGLKPISYFENVVLREKLKEEGYDEGIFLSRGFVAEGTRSNIFWVKDGVVFTPPLSLGILRGIIRRKVIDLCRKYKIRIKEQKIKPSVLLNADEIFLTSSLLGVAPVSLVDIGNKKRRLKKKKKGISYFLREKLAELEECYISNFT